MAKCYYCGNNPVPHWFFKTNEYVGELTNYMDKKTKNFPPRHFVEEGAKNFVPRLANFLAKTGLVTFGGSWQTTKNSRNQVIWEEADRRGIPMHEIYFNGKPMELFRATVDGEEVYFDGLPLPPGLDLSATEWLDDKALLKERLIAENIPVARGAAFSHYDWKNFLAKFNELRKPVIVKPARGSRGRHTTTNIHTEEDLKKAFNAAKQIAKDIVIEEHLIGSVYRGTIVDGVLAGVLRGDPPRITGDGVHTVAELIEIKNKTKHHLVKDVVINPYIEQFLKRKNLTVDSTLKDGERIDLIEKIGISYGGYKAEEIHITHPKTKEYLTKAGQIVGFPVMGFDFIIEDITKDPDTQKWGIIECNSLPFIDLHHHPLEGPSINVAKLVWDLWEKKVQ